MALFAARGPEVRAVAEVVKQKGSDAWFTETPASLLASYDPTKDPAAPPTYYVAALGAADTIDTIPEETLLATGADDPRSPNQTIGAADTAAAPVRWCPRTPPPYFAPNPPRTAITAATSSRTKARVRASALSASGAAR